MYFSQHIGATIQIVLVILCDIPLTEVVLERLTYETGVADLQCADHLYT